MVQNWVDNGEDPADWVWDGTAEQWEKADNTTAIAHGTDNDQNVVVDVALDKAGRRTGLTNPLSKTWTTAYSVAAGAQQVTLTEPAGNITTRVADRLGRPASITYAQGTSALAATPDVAFEYDLAGNRTKMTETESAATVRETLYTYDAARRLTKVAFDTDGDGTVEQAVAYRYDGSGPRTHLTLPDGRRIEYEYDVNGRLVKMSDWDGQHVAYAWDLAGRLIAAERSNELRSRYRYDAGGRLVDLTHEQRGQTLARFAYTVNALGNRTQVVETLMQPDDTTDVQTIDYAYDALSRLLEADYDSGTTVRSYSYDLAGNLVNMEGQTRTYNAANQLTNDGTNALTYDDNGNLTSDGVNSYAWDRANRLRSMGGISYQYDGLGNRVSQTANSIVTEYLLDVQPGLVKVLAETTSGDTTRYVHGPRGLERQQDSIGDWVFPIQDGLGSVRGVAGNAGGMWPALDVLGTQMYAPYGSLFGAEGTMGTAFGFTGEQTDDNDLVFLRARYYEPGLGVFASVDPLETPNRYAYVGGNPISRVDPSGLQDPITAAVGFCTALPEVCLVAALLGISALAAYQIVKKEEPQLPNDLTRRAEAWSELAHYSAEMMFNLSMATSNVVWNSLINTRADPAAPPTATAVPTEISPVQAPLAPWTPPYQSPNGNGGSGHEPPDPMSDWKKFLRILATGGLISPYLAPYIQTLVEWLGCPQPTPKPTEEPTAVPRETPESPNQTAIRFVQETDYHHLQLGYLTVYGFQTFATTPRYLIRQELANPGFLSDEDAIARNLGMNTGVGRTEYFVAFYRKGLDDMLGVELYWDDEKEIIWRFFRVPNFQDPDRVFIGSFIVGTGKTTQDMSLSFLNQLL